MKHIGLGMIFCISLFLFAARAVGAEVVVQEETVPQQEQTIEQVQIAEQPAVEDVEGAETREDTREDKTPKQQEEVKISEGEVVQVDTGEEQIEEPQIEESQLEQAQEDFISDQVEVIPQDTQVLKEESQVPVIDTVLPRLDEMVLDQVPFVPKEIVAEDLETAELEEAQIGGVDTVSLEEGQGNWLFKRMWWERAQETYQKLKIHVDKIMERRAEFFNRRSMLDKALFDAFYLTLGMGIAEFTTVLRELRSWVSSERPEGEILSAEKQHILDALKMEQETIEQVAAHVDQLKKIDNAIENSLGIVIEVVNSARRFDREGWEYFKEIGLVLSEKKARELFYKLDVSLQNVKQLSNYLEKPFVAYFSKLEDRARQTVTFLQSQLTMLKEKEIDLKEQVDELNRKIDVQEQEEIEELEEEIIKKSVSWWEAITERIVLIFRTLRSFLPW